MDIGEQASELALRGLTFGGILRELVDTHGYKFAEAREAAWEAISDKEREEITKLTNQFIDAAVEDGAKELPPGPNGERSIEIDLSEEE